MASTTTPNGARGKARSPRASSRSDATAAPARAPRPKTDPFAAFAALSTPIMIVDPDLTITHLNDAARALMEEAEPDFCALWPAFRAAELVGQSADQFYPGSQRRLLSAEQLPARSQFDAGTHRFDLFASPIADGSGRARAVAIEWRDEAKLDEFQRRLAIIDRAQAVIEFTPDGIVLGANENFREAMGYSVEEIAGKHHRMFVDPVEAASPEYAQFWPNLARGQYVAGDFLRIDKRGQAVWLRASYNPITDRNGSTVKVVKYATAITKEKLQQEDLLGQMAAIHRAQAVIEFSPEGIVLGANENFRETMGYSVEEIVGKHHRMFVDPVEAASPEYAQFWPSLARGQYVAGDFLRIDKRGGAVWLRASYNPIADRNGVTAKVVKYATDISEERQYQDSMQRSQAVIEFTPDGIVVGANDNFRQTMGYAVEEIVGKHHRMFVDPVDAASPDYAQFWASLARGQYVSGDFQRIDKSGRRIWLRASYNPITDRTGKTVKIVKSATDITEERRQQESMQQLVAEASLVMASVADGDLTNRIDGDYLGHLAQLQDATNNTIHTLNQLVAQIRGTAVSISNSAVEVAQANQDLSRRTEAQASSLEETASSMEEMTATVQQNADNARTASQLAVGAREQAESGGHVVDRAVEAVRAISDSSKKIADIIGVIDEIAFQTNLLALNAAVEAARAGDQGRGFAVVASEVRNLAQRSAGAAKEIKALIQDSLGKVEDGSNLVNQSGVGLAEIVGSVKKVSDIIGEIAAASVEQAAGINEVNQAVTTMDQGTQQNAAMVEQAAAASESLQQQAQGLLGLTERFKFTWAEQHDAPQAAPSHAAQHQPTQHQPAPRQAAPYPPVRSARPAAAERPAARPVASGSGRGDEAWQEF